MLDSTSTPFFASASMLSNTTARIRCLEDEVERPVPFAASASGSAVLTYRAPIASSRSAFRYGFGVRPNGDIQPAQPQRPGGQQPDRPGAHHGRLRGRHTFMRR